MTDKPKCYLIIKQGARGRWRWVARSTEARTVASRTYAPNEGLAMGVGAGFEDYHDAVWTAQGVMRGWFITSIERVPHDLGVNHGHD